MLRITLVATLGLGLLACTTPDSVARIDARPLKPSSSERVAVDDLLVIADSSRSVTSSGMFPEEKALLEAYVASLPEGSYEAGSVTFGGFKRQSRPLASFDRARFEADARQIEDLRHGTPLYKVLDEARDSFRTRSGKAAVVIFTDGLVTDEFGRPVATERSVAAARRLAADYQGEVCFHTVQLGDSPVGAETLRAIAGVTSCGSTRTARATASSSALHDFQREVFLAKRARTLPPVAAAPPPAKVVSKPVSAARAPGPWSVHFGFDSTQIDSRYAPRFEEIKRALERDPKARLRVSGHTDGKGSVEYNERLSLRRAEATRRALVGSGIDASRLEVRAYGLENPLMPNDSEEHRQANRRTEIELVR